MGNAARVAIIGEFNPSDRFHVATREALERTSKLAEIPLEVSWLSTTSLVEPDATERLAAFDGFWAAPGSPYASFDGSLTAIRFARERKRPFLGT